MRSVVHLNVIIPMTDEQTEHTDRLRKTLTDMEKTIGEFGEFLSLYISQQPYSKSLSSQGILLSEL